MTADELASLSEKAARLIAGGGGLRALAQMLADETQGAVLIEDDQWRHLALAESRGGVGSLPPSFAPFYRKARQADRNGTVVRAAVSPSLHALCVQMPGAGDAEAGPGYVTLFVREKSRADAIPALRIAASAVGVEYARRGAGRGQGKLAFWEHFLSGDMTDAVGRQGPSTSAGHRARAGVSGERLRSRRRFAANLSRCRCAGACTRRRDVPVERRRDASHRALSGSAPSRRSARTPSRSECGPRPARARRGQIGELRHRRVSRGFARSTALVCAKRASR